MNFHSKQVSILDFRLLARPYLQNNDEFLHWEQYLDVM